MDARLALAFIGAVSAFAFLGASPSDGPATETVPAGFKAELAEPKAGPDGQLKIALGTTINGVVRVVGLEKETTSEVVFFRFMRGSAMGGEFVGKAKRIDDHTVEYKALLKSPPAPGNYVLQVVPGNFTPSGKAPPARDRYPSLKTVVVR